MLWGPKHTRSWMLLLITTPVLLQMINFPVVYLILPTDLSSLICILHKPLPLRRTFLCLEWIVFYVTPYCCAHSSMVLRLLPFAPGASPAKPALSLGRRTTIQAQRRRNKNLALIISPIIRAEALPVETMIILSRTPSTCPRNSFKWHACSKWKERKKKKNNVSFMSC